MTDPSLQKMQTTPERNVQKMHIPAEWVEAQDGTVRSLDRATLATVYRFRDTLDPKLAALALTARRLSDETPQGATLVAVAAALAEADPMIREDERRKGDWFMTSIAKVFDRDDVSASFLSEDGDDGFAAATRRAIDEVKSLRAERDRYREALERIACFHDQFGNAGLTVENTYSGFDEPVSVKIARQSLKGEAV